jgi:PAS domain S-box-containing protein
MDAYSLGLYSYILIATTLIALGISVILWPYRKFKGVLWIILLEIAAAEWAFGIMFEAAATTVALKQLWSAIAFIGTCAVPPFFFLFAAEYNLGKNWISYKVLLLFTIMPVFTVIMAFTNPWHYQLWTSITITSRANVAIYEHGAIWWLIYIYEYLLIILGLYFLLKTAFKSGSFYTPHNTALLIGAILPIIGNVMYVFGPNPIPGLDWAPIGFALSGVILSWGILRLNIFKLTPIAHTLLVTNMPDGMIVLDTSNQIVDLNPALAALFQRTPKQLIGKRVNQIFALSTELDNFLQSINPTQIESDLSEIQPGHTFELRLSILHDQFSQIVGKSLVLRDITERKKTEAERERLIGELKEALNQVKTLSGLLPICAHCKNIRDDQGYWHDVEEYIHQHTDTDFSHSICPDCLQKYYPEIAQRIKARKEKESQEKQ